MRRKQAKKQKKTLFGCRWEVRTYSICPISRIECEIWWIPSEHVGNIV